MERLGLVVGRWCLVVWSVVGILVRRYDERLRHGDVTQNCDAGLGVGEDQMMSASPQCNLLRIPFVVPS